MMKRLKNLNDYSGGKVPMKLAPLVALAIALIPAVASHAATPSANPIAVPYSNVSLHLNSVTALDVHIVKSDGTALPAPRHRLAATLADPPSTCPADYTCAPVAPNAKVSVYFREWDFSKTRGRSHLFSICRRTIESAPPTAKIILTGDIRYFREEDSILMSNLTGCYVGSDPKPQ